MQKLLFVAFFFSVSAGFTSCSTAKDPVMNAGQEKTSFLHPAWSHQSNIYEVNWRQYSATGTISAFSENLPRLKEMGVEILWFMPVTPIGLKDRKMDEKALGSYYSVKDYQALNPELGTMAEWKRFVHDAQTMGFKVIIDWVANHSSADNGWITRHPDFYAKDSLGNIISPFDWTDTRKLDYANRELRDSMIAAMKFWINESGIDGFRCDVAEEVPADFWKEAITELRKVKDVFMLAEGEKPVLHYSGFDATYSWSTMRLMEDVYRGKQGLEYFDSVLNHNISVFPKNAYRMYFTSNHDENSWNGTEFEKYGDASAAFAVFSQTMYQSIPLIYSGQEAANNKRLEFFVKDSINWNGYSRAQFYSTLLHLRKRNPALAAEAYYKRIVTANDVAVFSYIRHRGKNKVLIILNLSSQPQHFTIKEKEVYGNAREVFSGKTEKLFENHVYEMEPWRFLIYEY